MKVFDAIQSFFGSIGEYVENFSMLFFIFLGAFLAVSIVVIFITAFAYECQLTKTIDKINKFLERNPRINDDNLVAFNNMMKAGSVPKILRRQWQQFMLYREHPASYYMSFKHCVENPLRNSVYKQQMTVYKVISYILVVLSLVVSTFMAVQSYTANLVLQDIIIIPITLLVSYWLVSMVLNLIHSAVSSDLFQNYQYFEINIDKAMLTLPEFVDYEVLFSQDEIRRGIPVLFAYLQKRAIQEQQELEKARLKSVDHEKFDFDQAGLDGSLVLDRAMRETENFSTQRKKYLQEIERVNNEISILENNYKEQIKDYQRQVQTSKETVENLKEQLEQASSTIEINYLKKQMRDEINRQQVAEKDFDILTDKHNQEIKSLNQEIKRYDEETKKAREALETSMLSEFNTYSVKVYDNLEKIVDEKMQLKVDDYKDQIKGLEIQLEEKNEELENVYTRYQEVLSQVPAEPQQIKENYTELPTKKGKKKKKGSASEEPVDSGMVQPEQVDEYQAQYGDEYAQYDNVAQDYQSYDEQPAEQYDYNTDYSYDNQNYDANAYGTYEQNAEFANPDYSYDENQTYSPQADEQYAYSYDDAYQPMDEGEYGYDNYQYDSVTENDQAQDNQYYNESDYASYDDNTNSEPSQATYDDYNSDLTVDADNNESEEPKTLEEEKEVEFNDADFDIDFANKSTDTSNFDDMSFDFDFGDDKNSLNQQEPVKENIVEEIAEDDLDADFDLDKVLGLYDNISTDNKSSNKTVESKPVEEDIEDVVDDEIDEEFEDVEDIADEDWEEELPSPEQPKRRAGRPRKIVDEDEIKPKRGVGRPRKVVDEEDRLETPKRGRGRPRKQEVVVEKRGVGRPKKQADENTILAEPKRKAGRPRKLYTETVSVKRSVGRPRKDKMVIGKRSVGRPRKEEMPVKRGVGRPKKNSPTVTAPKRGRGRPRKS